MRLGVVGTFVWDTIWTLADVQAGRPFETWGGVAYSLAAAAAARADGWAIVPIVKVGADLAGEARRFMAGLPGVDAQPGVLVVPEPNNRVELRYTDDARRGERLTGGVNAWTWDDLDARLAGIDALYVNFLSGFEMGLETAERLRASFAGPIYADLHSLFLGCPGAGARVMRSLPEWERWAACFHAVQMNEDELGMLGAPGDDAADHLAERLLAHGPGMVLVTRGGEGATATVRDGFPADPLRWPGWKPGGHAQARSTTIASAQGRLPGDPTGAGDVWGVTFFCSLLAGMPVVDAVRRAHRFAGAKMSVRGAAGLYPHLVTGGLF
ncbi:MAG: carbohydrate kinase family protein [Gemmatimonadetes bacterium]|nr:carbohydrate kinase family protein [Gemmatimonadota bacterium]